MTRAWVRNPAVLWRETAAGVLLLPPRDDEVLVLTDSGAALWELLDTPVALGAAARHLATTYSTTPEIVEEGIVPLLADLERRDVVRQVP